MTTIRAVVAVLAIGIVLGVAVSPGCAHACQGQLSLPMGDVTKEILAVTGTALAATATAERLAHEKTTNELFGYATMVALGRKELVECWRARVLCEAYTPTPLAIRWPTLTNHGNLSARSSGAVPTYTPTPGRPVPTCPPLPPGPLACVIGGAG